MLITLDQFGLIRQRCEPLFCHPQHKPVSGRCDLMRDIENPASPMTTLPHGNRNRLRPIRLVSTKASSHASRPARNSELPPYSSSAVQAIMRMPFAFARFTSSSAICGFVRNSMSSGIWFFLGAPDHLPQFSGRYSCASSRQLNPGSE